LESTFQSRPATSIRYAGDNRRKATSPEYRFDRSRAFELDLESIQTYFGDRAKSERRDSRCETLRMSATPSPDNRKLLLMVAGIKGAVASTLALAVSAMQREPHLVLPSLTTAGRFPHLPAVPSTVVTGWDIHRRSMTETVSCQQILPDAVCRDQSAAMERLEVRSAPEPEAILREQVKQLEADIEYFRSKFPGCLPVLVNLLPAAPIQDLTRCENIEDLYRIADPKLLPDIAYAMAAVLSGIALVNFTPNEIELPVLIREAETRGIPVAGRDGKTGQTYLKVVLASALKARSLTVDGWYSLNILGNEDGRNLMEPERAAGKVANKTDLLNDILGYPVGERYGRPTHTVKIDYYPPRKPGMWWIFGAFSDFP